MSGGRGDLSCDDGVLQDRGRSPDPAGRLPLAKEYGDANGIRIQTWNYGDYDSMVQKIQAAITTHSLPHIAILGQRHGIPQLADSDKLIPLAATEKGVRGESTGTAVSTRL